MRRKKAATNKGGATRQRIVTLALGLFNENGPDRVTTAQIAAAAGINEGNLYYHFRTKEALVAAVLDRFEADAMDLLAEGAEDSADPTASLGLLQRWFALVWDYRFLLRDMIGLLALSPELRLRVRALSAHLREAVEVLAQRLRERDLLIVPDEQFQPLLANLWIVATYWALYLDLHEGIAALTPDHLAWGLGQVRSLLRPYLAPALQALV
ncbi:TetR/AcrR family transcriptional regulator [Labrys sp. LIt4]|uniref:TetR family transcriptional regulator n=1 Tax=Labrys okinawensis TaxID=346911 RepID=A0A2S9QD93_9HYPH|nr:MULTISPECIES: TetR/AcrR family transcriptional regulator [Labrys]MBP0581964.1 TetR/AcrR family transcriptional regulator [Labrys sp. LIt4]PRH87319.1 TetR family transcriptional regulator [Labrys okinawensis]